MSMSCNPVALHCQVGTSDKVYLASIVPQGEGFVVQCQYGRRGAALQTVTKPKAPTTEQAAQKILDSLVSEKLAKGYVPMGSAPPPVVPNTLSDALAVMLLEPITVEQLPAYIADERWALEPKYDGQRIVVHARSGPSGLTIMAQNREGKAFELASELVEDLHTILTTPTILDGEVVQTSTGPIYYVFDVVDMPSEPYAVRRTRLEALLGGLLGSDTSRVRPAIVAYTSTTKQALFDTMREARGEGVVGKRVDRPYVADRRLDVAIKCKFWDDVTALVIARNDTGAGLSGTPVVQKKLESGKRSVQMALTKAGTLVNVGDISVPVNYPVPEPGTLIRVRYLYAFPDTDKLFQPQYEGTRDDVSGPDSTAQLKYKRTE